jgi:nucleoid-associated protein YgaU
LTGERLFGILYEHMFATLDIRRLLAALAVAATLVLGFAAPSPGEGRATHYVVRPGDSLWRIAERRYPGSDPREAVYRIEHANGLRGALVQAGRRLVLP